LLALIEGMGIMFTRMMAPPVPTAEDYERQMQQQQMDITAPPTQGGLFPSGLFGGSSGTPSEPASSPIDTAPPSFIETDGITTFSTEGSSSSLTSSKTEGSGSSWWPFGSDNKQ
jgi:hypothetical protein